MEFTSPEPKLLLCAARQFVSSEPAEGFPELLRHVTDWPRLFELASRHGVSPLVAQLLHQFDRPLPEFCATQLQAESRERARQSLYLTAELLKVLDLFETHSIPALAFKGPVLAASLYGNIALRESVDLDILIRREDVPRAKEAMLAQGYRTDLPTDSAPETAYLRARYELHFTTENGLLIEIHQAFLAPYCCFSLDDEALWRRLERKSFCGREILALTPEDLLLALSAHATKHRWSRLAWICDVARLLVVSNEEIDWPLLTSRASSLGAGRMLRLGVFLAGHLLGAPVPAEIMQSAEQDQSLVRLAGSVVKSLFREDTAAGDLGDHLFFLNARERFRDKLVYCTRLAFTPTEEDHSALSLPSLLSPLYCPLHAFRVMGKYGLTSLKSLL